MRITRPAPGLDGNFKCLREQRVTGENRNALAEDFVIREFASAIIVVVHRWQIVVHQRIGMDAFDGAGERKCVGRPSTTGRRRRENEGGAHSFAAGKQRVTHRLVDGDGLGGFRGQKLVERGIYGSRAGCEEGVEAELASFCGRNEPFGCGHAEEGFRPSPVPVQV